MKRVYTDERFQGFEVHNDGSNTFHVFERMPNGNLEEIDVFKTYSKHPTQAVDPETAEKRARAYFERMAKGKMTDEFGAREADEASGGGGLQTLPFPGNPDRDHSDIFNEPTPPSPPREKVSLDDLIGNNVMSPDDVLDKYQQASAISDPAQKEKAMEQVRQMSYRMESSAAELVRSLLD